MPPLTPNGRSVCVERVCASQPRPRVSVVNLRRRARAGSHNSSVRWLCVWLFALAVATRVAGQLLLGAFEHPAVFEYEEIASNLVAGHGYTYASPDGGIYVASQSSPLYIVLTAAVYLVTGHSQQVMLVLQAVLGGATAVLVAWVGGRTFSAKAGMAAGVLVALDPALIVYAAELHSLTLDALANVGLICASLALPVRPRARQTALVGIVFGVSALTRATALTLLPLHLLWLRGNRALRFGSLGAAVLVVTAVVVYSPWPVRNSILLGQVVLGSSETTEWLWRGNNPNADGDSLNVDNQRMLYVAPAEFRAQIAAASEAERIRLYQDAAVSFIRSDPAAAARLYLNKMKDFWIGSDQTGLLYPPMWAVGYAFWYGTMVLAAAVGLWFSRTEPNQRRTVALVVGTLLMVSAVQAVFYVEGRHRLAVEPLLLILSGYGVAHLLARFPRVALRQRPALRSAAPRADTA